MTGEELPDRRRHGYRELEQKLDKHAHDLDVRLSKFFRKCLIAFAIIGITSAIAIGGYGLVLRTQGKQADEIQQQREFSIRTACVDQNVRHDNTIDELNKASAKLIEENPGQKKAIEASVAANTKILEAAIPKKDCKKLVNQSVASGG